MIFWISKAYNWHTIQLSISNGDRKCTRNLHITHRIRVHLNVKDGPLKKKSNYYSTHWILGFARNFIAYKFVRHKMNKQTKKKTKKRNGKRAIYCTISFCFVWLHRRLIKWRHKNVNEWIQLPNITTTYMLLNRQQNRKQNCLK